MEGKQIPLFSERPQFSGKMRFVPSGVLVHAQSRREYPINGAPYVWARSERGVYVGPSPEYAVHVVLPSWIEVAPWR